MLTVLEGNIYAILTYKFDLKDLGLIRNNIDDKDVFLNFVCIATQVFMLLVSKWLLLVQSLRSAGQVALFGLLFNDSSISFYPFGLY